MSDPSSATQQSSEAIAALRVRLTLTYRNRGIECPDASKTIGNQLAMKKYIGAVLRKSSQLELVAEIGPFENSLPAQKTNENTLKNYY